MQLDCLQVFLGLSDRLLSDHLNIFDDVDSQRFTAVPYCYLMTRKGLYIHSGMPGHLFRNHQLAAVFFGEVLQAAGDGHGIADGGETAGGAITHAPDDSRSTVDSDADFQRLCEL